MSEFKRQHPVAAITQLLSLIRQNLVTIIIVVFIGSTRDQGEYFWHFFLGSLVFAIIAGIFSWWRFTYRVYEDELQIKKGIIVRNNLYLNKERIQVIDITEGILQRMFNLVKVEIKTAGSGTESATISAISRGEAESLRKELRKKNGEAGEQAETSLSEEEEIPEKTWEISQKDLMTAAFTSGNFGLIASILGAVSGQMDEFINEETINYVYETLPGYSNVTIIAGLVLAILLISWLLSFLGVIFKYSDFKLEKKRDELIITSGLLERKHITVPFDRIQAVRFVEGILRQPFGYGMLYVESAGFDQGKKEKSIVLVPLLAAEKVSHILNEFLPDFDEPEYQIRPPKRSKFRYIRRPNYLLFLAVPLAWLYFDYGWIAGLLIPLMAWLGWLRYKDAALALGEKVARMRYRVLSRTTALVKKNRIQDIELVANPFQRIRKLQSLKVVAASGAGGIGFEISDLSQEDSLRAYNWVTDHDEASESENIAETSHIWPPGGEPSSL